MSDRSHSFQFRDDIRPADNAEAEEIDLWVGGISQVVIEPAETEPSMITINYEYVCASCSVDDA